MTPEEKKKADEAAKIAEQAEEKKKADEAAKEKKVLSGTFIMKVTHLSWGEKGKNHFYAKEKPLISAKVMGKYANTLKLWLDKGWIEKGEYKK